MQPSYAICDHCGENSLYVYQSIAEDDLRIYEAICMNDGCGFWKSHWLVNSSIHLLIGANS